MQRQKVKSVFFVLQRLTQRRGDIGKARFPQDKCTDHPRSSIPEDWVVVCAVIYEPVSTPNCLISGFLQGIFMNSCLLSENAPAFAALIQ